MTGIDKPRGEELEFEQLQQGILLLALISANVTEIQQTQVIDRLSIQSKNESSPLTPPAP